MKTKSLSGRTTSNFHTEGNVDEERVIEDSCDDRKDVWKDFDSDLVGSDCVSGNSRDCCLEYRTCCLVRFLSISYWAQSSRDLDVELYKPTDSEPLRGKVV